MPNIFFILIYLQPPQIQAIIDKVIQCPLQDIEIPLSGFRWEYSKVASQVILRDIVITYRTCVCNNYSVYGSRGIFITGGHCSFTSIRTLKHIYQVGTTFFWQMIC